MTEPTLDLDALGEALRKGRKVSEVLLDDEMATGIEHTTLMSALDAGDALLAEVRKVERERDAHTANAISIALDLGNLRLTDMRKRAEHAEAEVRRLRGTLERQEPGT